MSTLRLLGWSGSFVFALFLVLAVRNLYLHPHSKHPGPLFSRCSSIPRDWMIYKAEFSDWTRRLHEKYGPCVRIAPNELSYATLEALDNLTGGSNLHGSAKYKHFRGHESPSNLVLKQEQEQEIIIIAHLDKVASRLKGFLAQRDKFSDRFIDMCSLLDSVFLDTESELMFGKPLGVQDAGSLIPVPLPKLNSTLLRAELITQSFGIASPLVMKIAGIHTEVEEARRTLEALKNSLIGNKPASTVSGINKSYPCSSRKVNMNPLTNPAEKPVTHEQMLPMLIETGIRPLTALSSACIFYLLSMPTVREEVINQIRTTFSSEHEIGIESTRSLHRLNSAIRETLRLNPFSRPFLASRRTESAEFCGDRLPAGTLASVDTCVANTSQTKYDEPLEFRPERFSQSELDRIPDTYGSVYDHYLPRAQVRVTLARLLWQFDFELECISDDAFPRGPLDRDADVRDFRWAEKPVYFNHGGIVCTAYCLFGEIVFPSFATPVDWHHAILLSSTIPPEILPEF
ncbi:cytochrome P450 [Macrophomina phaseolina]|uniref:Cytochrome P450 n=1 Tax=Macrophomina phaseolina TaxID=35725 RepID=A0ABQ8G899_9PEZI|nr:cytochrome P450 [Macrophomina phaseolina]